MQLRTRPRETPPRTTGRAWAIVATTALALALAFVAACSTPRGAAELPEPEEISASAAVAATPSPTPPPEPTPVQPQAMYRVTVSTEDGATEEAILTPEGPAATAEESDGIESAEPAVEATATPEATPKPGNVFTNLWRKIFPGKPSPSETAPQPEPTPDVIRVPTPREGIFSRMWHMVFPRKQPPPAALPPQWIGTIKLVHESGGYALIDTQGFIAPPPGEILRSVGGDMETGSLKISTDRNPPFFIADIVGGKPQPGDRVYSPTSP